MGIIIEQDLPQIDAMLREHLGAEGCQKLERLGGLTNHTYHATLADGREYAVRIPGEGTEEMIVRSDEKTSTELACRLGIDAQMLFFGADGRKLTEYIPNAQTMTPETMRDPARIAKAAAICRKIHSCGEDTGVPFDVFDMAATYEKIIRDQKVALYEDYEAVKATVMEIKAHVDAALNPPLVPCHNDPLCANWVESGQRLYLIDWEYAGMNDGMWDLAAVSIEAEYGPREDTQLLRDYLGREPSKLDREHFLGAKLNVDYLWTLWALTRVPFSGQDMQDWADERYARLKNNITAYRAL